jgi:hypothetical protein
MSRHRPRRTRIRKGKELIQEMPEDAMDGLLDIDTKAMTMTGHLNLSAMEDVEILIRRYTNGD